MAIFLNFVFKTALIWLVLGGFFCVFSQSETICNLHSCYKFCTHVTNLHSELHSFLSQSALSNFFAYIFKCNKCLMRLRRPSLWLILPAMYSTWFVHVKSDDIKIPRYLKLLTLFTLWSKIDTVRAILLSNFLLLPTSIHLVFSRFKVSLWSFSHFATTN